MKYLEVIIYIIKNKDLKQNLSSRWICFFKQKNIYKKRIKSDLKLNKDLNCKDKIWPLNLRIQKILINTIKYQ